MKTTITLTLFLSVGSASLKDENALLQGRMAFPGRVDAQDDVTGGRTRRSSVNSQMLLFSGGRKVDEGPRENPEMDFMNSPGYGSGPAGGFPMDIKFKDGDKVLMTDCTSGTRSDGTFRGPRMDMMSDVAAAKIQSAWRRSRVALCGDTESEQSCARVLSLWMKPAPNPQGHLDDYIWDDVTAHSTPCAKCIEYSDPGVYKPYQKLWESFPSFEPMSNKKYKAGKTDLQLNEEVQSFTALSTVPWGMGHMCCRKLSAIELERQPLCGICMRYHGGGLGGDWAIEPDCAAEYCEADGFGTKPLNDAWLLRLAAKCGGQVDIDPRKDGMKGLQANYGPKAIGEPDVMKRGSTFPPGPDYPEHYLAVVANNPRKKDLSVIFRMNKDLFIPSLVGKITGTGSSSGQCGADLGQEMRGAAVTTSGPFGGDVQCGGIIAEDWRRVNRLGKTRAIEGLIFMNDEREPHRLDIIALKRLLRVAMPREQYSLHENDKVRPRQVIEHVARANGYRRGMVDVVEDFGCGGGAACSIM